MYFIEFKGFNRTTKNINDISFGCDVIEVWTNYVFFETDLARSKYFQGDYTESCLIVSVDGVDNVTKMYRFAFNDRYVDDRYPMTETLPNDAELEAMLADLIS